MSDTETICKLFLELSQVVPLGTRTERELRYESAMRKALQHMNDAPLQLRNGPVYRAADALRNAMDLPASTIGGKFTEDLS